MNNDTKLVYLFGPYRSRWGAAGRIWNIFAAWRMARRVLRHPLLRGRGWFPVTPHLNTALMDGAAPDGFFLDGTLELGLRCDAMLAVHPERWRQSAGSVNEVYWARNEGVPVFFTVEDFTIYVAAGM